MFGNLHRYLSDMLFLMGPERRKLPWIMSSFLLVALLDLLGLAVIAGYIILLTQSRDAATGLLSTLVNTIKLQDNGDSQLVLGLALVVIFGVKAVTAILVQRYIFRFAADQGVSLRARLSSTILQMPFEVFASRNSSEYVRGLVSYVSQFSNSVVSLLRLAAEGIIALAIVLMLLAINGTAVLLLIAVSLVLFITYDRLIGPRLRHAGHSGNTGNQVMIKGIQEGISGLKELRILGCEKYFSGQVKKGSQQAATAVAFIGLMGTVPRYLVEVAIILFVVTLVALFMLQGDSLEAMYPVIGMLGLAALRVGPATGMAIQAVGGLRAERPAISSLRQEFSGTANQPNYDEEEPISGHRFTFQSLELNHVGFSYRGAAHRAINEISLTVTAGESIGLIGPSGVGKTTLVDVILGLLTCQTGEIRYNGRPLTECLQYWWSNVAYLPQEVFLVDASLRENVALGIKPENIDNQRLSQALARASLADLKAELPQGVETLVGERGIRLSGGQRQRVALARALYHQREVLVMDEATSALDYETEREIVEEIRRLKGQKTMIVIAHRLTTLRHCDRIYRLEQGRVVAVSSYEEAVANGSRVP